MKLEKKSGVGGMWFGFMDVVIVIHEQPLHSMVMYTFSILGGRLLSLSLSLVHVLVPFTTFGVINPFVYTNISNWKLAFS